MDGVSDPHSQSWVKVLLKRAPKRSLEWGGARKFPPKPASFLLLYSKGISKETQQTPVPVLLPVAWYLQWNLVSITSNFPISNHFMSKVLCWVQILQVYILPHTTGIAFRNWAREGERGKEERDFLPQTAELCFKIGSGKERESCFLKQKSEVQLSPHAVLLSSAVF